MTTLESIADQLKYIEKSHDDSHKQIIGRLDKINGSVIDHDKRIQSLEKSDVEGDGEIKLLVQDITNFKEKIKDSKASIVWIIATAITGIGVITGIVNVLLNAFMK